MYLVLPRVELRIGVLFAGGKLRGGLSFFYDPGFCGGVYLICKGTCKGFSCERDFL